MSRALFGGLWLLHTMALIQASAGYGLSDRIRELGEEPRRAFVAAEIEEAVFEDPLQTVMLERFVTLLETAAFVTRRTDFGLRFADAYDIRRLGPVGYLLRHGRTLGDALGDYARYFNSLQSGTSVSLEASGGLAAMTYRIDDAVGCERRQDAEFSTAIVVNAARRICGTAWRCYEIQFEHLRPRIQSAHEEVLAAPVRFGAANNAILFPAALLNTTNPDADPLLVDALRRSLATALPLGRNPADIVETVRGAFMRAVQQGCRCAVRDIADELGCSVRSLQRGLGLHGTTFNALTTQVRIALAEQYLSHSDDSITVIALKLGFSETSAFSRAFKAYTGQAPRSFRYAKLG